MPQTCFSSVLKLTAQPDCFALAQALVEILLAETSASSARLFEVFEGDGDKRLSLREVGEPSGDRHGRLGFTPALAKSLAEKCYIDETLPSGQVRHYFPIPGENSVKRLLILDALRLEEVQRHWIGNLLAVYRNHLMILDRKDRDLLTGLMNRHTFEDRIMRVMADVGRGGAGAWLALLDIDHFKRVNDTFGHLYGDEVLLLFARLMQQSFRYTDFLFRYGGEEFVVLLTEVPGDVGMVVLERFRKAVGGFAFPTVGRVTVSIGCVRLDTGKLPDRFLDEADRALYFAKNTGRNQVVSFHDMEDGQGSSDRDGEVELF